MRTLDDAIKSVDDALEASSSSFGRTIISIRSLLTECSHGLSSSFGYAFLVPNLRHYIRDLRQVQVPENIGAEKWNLALDDLENIQGLLGGSSPSARVLFAYFSLGLRLCKHLPKQRRRSLTAVLRVPIAQATKYYVHSVEKLTHYIKNRKRDRAEVTDILRKCSLAILDLPDDLRILSKEQQGELRELLEMIRSVIAYEEDKVSNVYKTAASVIPRSINTLGWPEVAYQIRKMCVIQCDPELACVLGIESSFMNATARWSDAILAYRIAREIGNLDENIAATQKKYLMGCGLFSLGRAPIIKPMTMPTALKNHDIETVLSAFENQDAVQLVQFIRKYVDRLSDDVQVFVVREFIADQEYSAANRFSATVEPGEIFRLMKDLSRARQIDGFVKPMRDQNLCGIKILFSLAAPFIFASTNRYSESQSRKMQRLAYLSISKFATQCRKIDPNICGTISDAISTKWPNHYPLLFGHILHVLFVSRRILVSDGRKMLDEQLSKICGDNGGQYGHGVQLSVLAVHCKQVAEQAKKILGSDLIGAYYRKIGFIVDEGESIVPITTISIQQKRDSERPEIAQLVEAKRKKKESEFFWLGKEGWSKTGELNLDSDYKRLTAYHKWDFIGEKSPSIKKCIDDRADGLWARILQSSDRRLDRRLGSLIEQKKLDCPEIVRTLIARRLVLKCALDNQGWEGSAQTLGYKLDKEYEPSARQIKSNRQNFKNKLEDWQIDDLDFTLPKSYTGFTPDEVEYLELPPDTRVRPGCAKTG